MNKPLSDPERVKLLQHCVTFEEEIDAWMKSIFSKQQRFVAVICSEPYPIGLSNIDSRVQRASFVRNAMSSDSPAAYKHSKGHLMTPQEHLVHYMPLFTANLAARVRTAMRRTLPVALICDANELGKAVRFESLEDSTIYTPVINWLCSQWEGTTDGAEPPKVDHDG